MRKYDRKKLGWLQLFKQIVVVVVLALLVLNILIGVSRVDGVSMVPTLKNKRIVMSVSYTHLDVYKRQPLLR